MAVSQKLVPVVSMFPFTGGSRLPHSDTVCVHVCTSITTRVCVCVRRLPHSDTVCVCTSMHVGVCVYMRVYIHVCACMCVHTSMHVCVHVYVRPSIHVHVCACASIQVHVCVSQMCVSNQTV